MEDGILLVDKYSELAYADPSACRLLGFDDEGQVRHYWLQIRSALGFADLISCSGTGRAPLRCDSVDRTLKLELKLSMLDSPAFRGYIIRIRRAGISDLDALEMLIGSQVRNQNYINEAMIHDLRAPLNAMEIHLELLAENICGSQPGFGGATVSKPIQALQAIQGVRILKDELGRLNRTLRTLLDRGQPFQMSFVDFDLVVALHELLLLLKPKARQQGVEILLRCNEAEVLIPGNPDYLKQAFLNIAINALEAMPGGGKLLISVHRINGWAEVSFLDQGPGIAKELLDQICNVRFTTKPKGCGMGLYAARLVVAQAHNGSVEVCNAEQGGTCVTCNLPARPASRLRKVGS